MDKALKRLLKSVTEKQRKSAEKGISAAKQIEQIDDGVRSNLVECSTESADTIIARFTPVLPSALDDRRVMANAILRSSLFGVIEKGKRKYEKKIRKVTVKGLSLSVTGEQLDQFDFDVFLECLHRHNGLPLGSFIRFTAGSFLRAIFRDVGKANYVWLEGVLSRLAACSIELDDGQRTYQGSLLHDKYRDKNTLEYVIIVNPKMAVFFSDGLWSRLDTNERLALKGKALSLWLHSFYSSHEKPFAYKVLRIKEICGSQVSELFKFRQILRKALINLSSVTGWTCWIDEKTDLVHVKKTKEVGHE